MRSWGGLRSAHSSDYEKCSYERKELCQAEGRSRVHGRGYHREVWFIGLSWKGRACDDCSHIELASLGLL